MVSKFPGLGSYRVFGSGFRVQGLVFGLYGLGCGLSCFVILPWFQNEAGAVFFTRSNATVAILCQDFLFYTLSNPCITPIYTLHNPYIIP